MRQVGRLIGLLLLIVTMAEMPAAQAMERREACRMIDNEGRDPICGIWRMGGDGAEIAILPRAGRSSHFDIVVIDSPDMSVMPGTHIGSITATGKLGTYDAQFEARKGLLNRTLRYILTLDKDDRMQFESYKKGKKVALWRWIPYLFRVTVSDYNTRPSGVDGAVRMYPTARSSEILIF